jgi:hypothetical protein
MVRYCLFTFSVAVNVSKRTHKLEGKSLNVSLYVPPVAPPSYDNKILLKGLQASTTQDCLFNFIEAKSGCLPETMDYHSEQEGVVMITFNEVPGRKTMSFRYLSRYLFVKITLNLLIFLNRLVQLAELELSVINS